jgi:[protein-PII] uridylyltransferase
MLRDLDAGEIRIDTRQDTDRDATRVCFALADHPGIFSRLAGALSLVGANVVDARTHTTKDGFATAVFWVQDAEGNPYEAARLPRLKGMIGKTLKGEVVASQGAGRARQDQETRTPLRRADAYHLRQRGLRDLHDHRGRHPRPARACSMT